MEHSGIYKFTNEDITSYFEHLKNKENILSVIGSSNQILNAILAGTNSIDCFDISVFPQYYLFLQIASIISLSKEDYLKYYLSSDREQLFSDYLYEIISKNLQGKYKQFWDSLYMFDDGIDIYESLLFRQDFFNKETVIERNPYLQDNNYEKLQNILRFQNIDINPITANIMNAKFNKPYDLIILSNILSYNLKKTEYKHFLETNFNLSEKGEIINYIFDAKDEKEIYDELLNPNGYVENKILVYKK